MVALYNIGFSVCTGPKPKANSNGNRGEREREGKTAIEAHRMAGSEGHGKSHTLRNFACRKKFKLFGLLSEVSNSLQRVEPEYSNMGEHCATRKENKNTSHKHIGSVVFLRIECSCVNTNSSPYYTHAGYIATTANKRLREKPEQYKDVWPTWPLRYGLYVEIAVGMRASECVCAMRVRALASPYSTHTRAHTPSALLYIILSLIWVVRPII